VTVIDAAWLGAVQGLTEFLPISSSAHLLLARLFFGWDTERFGLAFDVACHAGTLIAVLVFFRRDLVVMARELPGAWRRATTWPTRLVQLIAVGTVPIVVLGLVGAGALEERMRTPGVVAVTLAAGSVLFLIAEAIGSRIREEQTLGWRDAFILGCAQAAALVPGLSRSGATISIGMLLGLRREAAARFSFLLGIPAIVAAAGYEGLQLRGQAVDNDTLATFFTGMAVSAIVGYAVIAGLLRYLARHSLHPFAAYRLVLAAAVVVWLVVR
jgi:undecaprenyl-diphosphatase